jgi:NTE family protein
VAGPHQPPGASPGAENGGGHRGPAQRAVGEPLAERRVRFIQQVNEWVEAGYLPEEYTHTEIRPVRFRRKLDWRTKLDRSPQFVGRLVRDGREAASEFLVERA